MDHIYFNGPATVSPKDVLLAFIIVVYIFILQEGAVLTKPSFLEQRG